MTVIWKTKGGRKFGEMQRFNETCGECGVEFSSAWALLRHFSIHASANKSKPKPHLPDLYPIASLKQKPSTTMTVKSSDENDSGIEDQITVRIVDALKLRDHGHESLTRCDVCGATFSRKFLLQRHQVKEHGRFPRSKAQQKMPALKPIGQVVGKKSRKQDKRKVKRHVCADESK